MPLDVNKYLNNKDEQKEDKNKSKGKDIIYNLLSVVVIIVVSVLVKSCVHEFFHDAHQSNEHYSEEEIILAKDVGFIKGFEMANTTVLENYCSGSGYIPTVYIFEFKKQFLKTLSNADKIYNKYFNTPEKKKIFEDKVFPASYNNLEKEFNTFNEQYGLNKKEYCKIFDEQKDTILKEKIQMLKQQKSNMYMD